MASPTQWHEFEQTQGDGEGQGRTAWHAAVHGVTRSRNETCPGLHPLCIQNITMYSQRLPGLLKAVALPFKYTRFITFSSHASGFHVAEPPVMWVSAPAGQTFHRPFTTASWVPSLSVFLTLGNPICAQGKIQVSGNLSATWESSMLFLFLGNV